MACAKITGLSNYQRNKISEMIDAIQQEDAPKEDYSIEAMTPINLRRQDSLWYGGSTAEIIYKGFTFSIEANGDVRAYLFDSDDTTLFDVKDRSNTGALYGEMLPYLKSDRALRQAMSDKPGKRRLHVEDGNWWEVFGATRSR